MERNVDRDSLCSADWGRFLNSVFDIWVREDIQRISGFAFDETLQQWCGGRNGAERGQGAAKR